MWYVVDGMDGCGKSSAASCITAQLESEGRRVLEITHPNRDTDIGKKEAEFLLQDSKYAKIMATVMYIFDVLHSVRVMRKAKKKGEYDDFVFVRYIMAVSYLPKSLAKLAYKFFEIALPTPDVKIFVDVTGPTAMARITSRGEQLETFETEEQLTETREKRLMFIPRGWHLVDNNGSFEDSKTQIYGILKEVRDGDP